jgi:hypothetical protein
MNQVNLQNTDRRQWPIYASYAAASGMVICFAAVFIQFLNWLFPNLLTPGVLFVCGFVVLEAFLSFSLVKRLPTAQRQIAYYRVTEMVILLLGLKIFTELRIGPENLRSNLSLWPVEFPFNILTGHFIIAMLPVLASWWAANLFAADLSLLGVEEASNFDERLKTTPIRTVILRRFLGLGMFVVILGGIPFQKVYAISLPASSNTIPAIISYFVLGTVLLSLTRYITLETTWWQSKLQIPSQIPRRWFAYSGVILAILVFIISWLPTNYGMGFLATLNAVMHLLYQFILLIYGLFLLVVALIMRLFLRKSTFSETPLPEIAPPVDTLPKNNTGSSGWELVQSIILWGSLIALAIIALRQYIAYNRDLSEDLRKFRPLRWLSGLWNRFRTSLKKADTSFRALIKNTLQRSRKNASGSALVDEWNIINFRRLSPRQKVIFYYLALIRRAKEAGIPREDSQTPNEYAHKLNSSLQNEKDAVDAMTTSFMEARYSRHDIPQKAARQAETVWETIRRVLRNFRR